MQVLNSGVNSILIFRYFFFSGTEKQKMATLFLAARSPSRILPIFKPIRSLTRISYRSLSTGYWDNIIEIIDKEEQEKRDKEGRHSTTSEHAKASEQYMMPWFVRIPNRKYLDIEGVDAVKFIQGLITNDMRAFETEASIQAANKQTPASKQAPTAHIFDGGINKSKSSMAALFLSRQGRIISDAIIYDISRANTHINSPQTATKRYIPRRIQRQQTHDNDEAGNDNSVNVNAQTQPSPAQPLTAANTQQEQPNTEVSRRFLLEFHADNFNELANHLLQHRLRAKVTIKKLDNVCTLLSTADEDVPAHAQDTNKVGDVSVHAREAPEEDVFVDVGLPAHTLCSVVDPRVAAWGHRVVLKDGTLYVCVYIYIYNYVCVRYAC
jgi:folate-binding Fe-S cluster repair protein YgfZ